jgi:hypothetical protein
VAHPQIAVFARLADGGADRLRAIEGQATLLGRTMHAIAYDAIHDEIVVPQQFGQAILTYAGDAAGEAPPKRVIIGSKTQLSRPDRVAIDAVNNEILVPEDDKVLVFPREGVGNVAPSRVLGGAEAGVMATDAVAVDAKRNLMIVAGSYREGDSEGNALMIFDRTASGGTKPKRVITGVADNRNIAVDSEGGWIFVTLPGTIAHPYGYVGVWSIDDSGKVPPRYRIGGPDGSLRMPRGVVLDRKNQSVIISDKKLNAILTFRIPEIFKQGSWESRQ